MYHSIYWIVLHKKKAVKNWLLYSWAVYNFFFFTHDFWYCSSSLHLSATIQGKIIVFWIYSNTSLNCNLYTHTESYYPPIYSSISLDSSSQFIFLTSYSLPIISYLHLLFISNIFFQSMLATFSLPNISHQLYLGIFILF